MMSWYDNISTKIILIYKCMIHSFVVFIFFIELALSNEKCLTIRYELGVSMGHRSKDDAQNPLPKPLVKVFSWEAICKISTGAR